MGHALPEAEIKAHLRFKTSHELYLDPTLSLGWSSVMVLFLGLVSSA